jgi:hypothetical protein
VSGCNVLIGTEAIARQIIIVAPFIVLAAHGLVPKLFDDPLQRLLKLVVEPHQVERVQRVDDRRALVYEIVPITAARSQQRRPARPISPIAGLAISHGTALDWH